MPENFTVVDAVRITELLPLVLTNSAITWTPDNGDTLFQGTARRFCTEDYMAVGEMDIRDAYIHVTMRGGVETLLPVRDCMAWLRTGALVGWWR